MSENKNIGNIVGLNPNKDTKKKSPYSAINHEILESNKVKIKENIEASYNAEPGFWQKNHKKIFVIILFIIFFGMLGYFIADGGSLWDVIESILWYFSWPVGVFLLGLLIKKILYL